MLIKMFNNSINRQEGFTFIEIVISMIILSVLISTIIHYHSSSGASSNQIYDLKAVNVLQSEANKLMAFYEIGSDDGEFEALGVGVSPPDNIFLFKYDPDTGLELPDPIHHVYYEEYYDDRITISIGNNNLIEDYHTYYEDAFNTKYDNLNPAEKKKTDIRTLTYCTVEAGESSPRDTDSAPNSVDVSMVVIDDMGSPEDPEDDLLGYIGWWVEDEGDGTNDIKKITLAFQYWYPGVDWKNVDPEVIVLEITII